MTIAILMKLLLIKIVARSVLGVSNNLIIRLALGDCSPLSSSKSLGDKEK